MLQNNKVASLWKYDCCFSDTECNLFYAGLKLKFVSNLFWCAQGERLRLLRNICISGLLKQIQLNLCDVIEHRCNFLVIYRGDEFDELFYADSSAGNCICEVRLTGISPIEIKYRIPILFLIIRIFWSKKIYK